MTDIILASASPRRAELLDQIGVRYLVKVADVDERSLSNETAETLVQRLAIEKSKAIVSKRLPVLGSDTLGLLNGRILVKPDDYEHAHEMLSQMSSNWHEILSAVAITHQGKTKLRLSKSRVLFRTLSKDEIKDYWDTGEPKDKAGAYAIQGLGASFIERIEGSYSGIMGLPLFETSQLLTDLGINILGCAKK